LALRFHGEFVSAFLQPEGRQRFIGWAARLASRSGAELAALFGKCVHLDAHDLGAWYWGRDDARAGAALLYAAGLFADPPAFEPSVFGSEGTVPARLTRTCASAPKAALEAAVADQGGRLERAKPMPAPADAGERLSGTTIRFPLGGPTRATGATRRLAAALLGADAGR
jgi:serine/threonine-protein kinase